MGLQRGERTWRRDLRCSSRPCQTWSHRSRCVAHTAPTCRDPHACARPHAVAGATGRIAADRTSEGGGSQGADRQAGALLVPHSRAPVFRRLAGDRGAQEGDTRP
eukprot:3379517-Prymnesium_polylepis.1